MFKVFKFPHLHRALRAWDRSSDSKRLTARFKFSPDKAQRFHLKNPRQYVLLSFDQIKGGIL